MNNTIAGTSRTPAVGPTPMVPQNDAGLAQFAAILQERVRVRQISAGSARAYFADVRDFAVYLAGQNVGMLSATAAHVRAYLAGLTATQQASTVRRKLVSLRRCYAGLVAAGLRQDNPVAELHLPKPRRPRDRRPPLTAATIKRLLAAPRLASVKGVRDRAMLTTMAILGLTVAETCRLDVADVDLQAETLRVIGKGARPRTVELTLQTAGELRRWLAARALLQPETTAMFTALHWTSGRTAPGQRISVRGVRQMVRGYLAQVGVTEPGVSCQALRRTYAALTLAAGGDLRAVAASLGHVSTVTTQGYAEDAALIKDNPARYLSGLL
ncbi:MAG: tyrosine-type recombinase/integrase [Chloroflexi bacterium]|nr:tyrosine-type recombinase/integrase [Chloroflexota bacterium]